jgi:hypothetical protein
MLLEEKKADIGVRGLRGQIRREERVRERVSERVGERERVRERVRGIRQKWK